MHDLLPPEEEGDPPRVSDELRYDYAGRCWWCGSVADSREHKWKRSDIVRMYGTGPYKGELVWGPGEDDMGRMLQGASSSELKYHASLCQRCNNARSQAFDKAYDVWASYVFDHLDVIKDWTVFDLARVYDSDREVRRADLRATSSSRLAANRHAPACASPMNSLRSSMAAPDPGACGQVSASVTALLRSMTPHQAERRGRQVRGILPTGRPMQLPAQRTRNCRNLGRFRHQLR